MKTISSALIALLCMHTVCAQLTITAGSQLSFSGNAQLILLNTDLVNDGSFSAGAGKMSFTGNTSSHISGSQVIRFNVLELNKTGGGKLVLDRDISVDQQISFTAGLLDLNGFDADLGDTGILQGESGSSRVIGSNGGEVLLHTTLNAPSQVNPGNLGLVITSSQDLGGTVIRRGHQSQGVGNGDSTVLRYFDITPANNTLLNATVRFQYFSEELNGLDGTALLLREKLGTSNWSVLGSTVTSINPYYVEKDAVPAFGVLALSSISSPLPVNFSLFNAACSGDEVLLTWKTTQEQNSHYFMVERSGDGSVWDDLGMIAAAGNSSVVLSYSFIDQTPGENRYYRVAEYDLDGHAQYTQMLGADCGVASVFKAWPNPVRDRLYINMTSGSASAVALRLLDSKGALVRQQVSAVLRGSNLLSMDVSGVATGVYFLHILCDNGQSRVVEIMKE
jgi:Secretion system C-terminal sorting domain